MFKEQGSRVKRSFLMSLMCAATIASPALASSVLLPSSSSVNPYTASTPAAPAASETKSTAQDSKAQPLPPAPAAVSIPAQLPNTPVVDMRNLNPAQQRALDGQQQGTAMVQQIMQSSAMRLSADQQKQLIAAEQQNIAQLQQTAASGSEQTRQQANAQIQLSQGHIKALQSGSVGYADLAKMYQVQGW